MIKTVAVISFWLTMLWLPAVAAAGQVVTGELRTWAKSVIQQEKSIAPVTREKSVAVLYYENRTGDSSLDPLQKGFALMLITDLAKIEGLKVVERVRLQALLEEMKLGVSGLVAPGTAPRLGHLLRAYWVTGGNLAGNTDKLEAHSRVLAVPTSQVLGEPDSLGSLARLFELEKDALFKIIKLLKIKPDPEELEDLRRPMSTNIDALMALFRGIEASDRRRYAEAARLYEEALKKDPQLQTARQALNELKRMRLLYGTPGTRHFLRTLKNYTSLTNSLQPKYPVKRMRTPRDVLAVAPENETNPPNLPPDFGAPNEPDRPTSPPDNRPLPGSF